MSNQVITVHYIKHWDADSKGYMELHFEDLGKAVQEAKYILAEEARDDLVILEGDADAYAPGVLFTITKAVLEEGSNWTGVPKGA